MQNHEEKMKAAIAEATKFIEIAKVAIQEIKEYQKECQENGYRSHMQQPMTSRKYARVKRQSLELSEALVQLRKP